MKAKKVIIAISAIAITLAMIVGIIGTTYAVTTNQYVPVTLALRTTHDGIVYINTALGFGAHGGGKGQLIYKIYAPNNSSFNKTIYCIRGGPGFGSTDWIAGSSSSPTDSVTYTKEFDLKRALIDSSEIPSAYQKAIPTIGSANYKKLLWVLDQCYVPEAADATKIRETLLEASGLKTSKYETELSDADIDVIQQSAIWYFTNYGDADYSSENINLTLDDAALGDWDTQLEQDAYDLYRYFITGAEANYENYTVALDEDGNIEAKPYKLKVTTPTVETIGEYKYVGPYRVIKNSSATAVTDVSMRATNNNGKLDISGVVKKINGSYVGLGDGNFDDIAVNQDLYFMFPATADTTNLQITLYGNYYATTAKYLSADAGTHNLNNEQPVVVLDKEKRSYEASIGLEEEKEFDLALRKSITKINETAPTVSRQPQVDYANLANGSSTTAKYNHPKDALEVDTNQYIEYTIHIYNEGQKKRIRSRNQRLSTRRN